ncbi:GGDEF domain-containing protein [Qipengyuania sphaerica]|uniref:GGDEF domain-containing protein n=1 Tax=Qipengyuania sphaerica TaxID=2867243 RepID=UPI001C869D62|nr:diguanylate cyclase [Qipengyuania sphaerica]MBX7539490.1 GGDEF domain-containing protein [Qipengyuania sphaerica]
MTARTLHASRRLLAMIAVLLCSMLLGLGSAQAREEAPGQLYDCHAATSATTKVSEVMQQDFAWRCDHEGWESKRGATWLTFPLDRVGAQAEPRIFAMRHAHFQSITIYALAGDQTLSERSWKGSQVEPALFGPFASVPLDEIGLADGQADRLLVKIVRPDLSSAGSEARLVASENDVGFSRATALILAALAGLVIMPLLFDASLYAILRQRFMLAHAGMCVGMLMVLNSSNGLFTALFEPRLATLVTLTQLGYVTIVGSAALFAMTFIERECLGEWSRRLLKAAIAIMLATSGLLAIAQRGFGPLDQNFYMYGFLPMFLAVAWAIGDALVRRSRMVWFIIVGWVPAILTGFDMIANGLGLQSARTLGVTAPFYAMAFEVCVTGVGVVTRIMVLRRERDEALRDKRDLEDISQRDPLTGLLNRRAIRRNFDGLVAQGFSAMAIYDIDDFKDVNDLYGHDVGDEVLVAAARALAPGPDVVAVRLGGEEFMLLLRGPNAIERAEMRRLDLTQIVKRSVPAIRQRVSASMGIVIFDGADEGARGDFNALYAHADKLLYQAKRLGKNIYQFEILTGEEAVGGELKTA